MRLIEEEYHKSQSQSNDPIKPVYDLIEVEDGE
jgi:hypothetical protein